MLGPLGYLTDDAYVGITVALACLVAAYCCGDACGSIASSDGSIVSAGASAATIGAGSKAPAVSRLTGRPSQDACDGIPSHPDTVWPLPVTPPLQTACPQSKCWSAFPPS